MRANAPKIVTGYDELKRARARAGTHKGMCTMPGHPTPRAWPWLRVTIAVSAHVTASTDTVIGLCRGISNRSPISFPAHYATGPAITRFADRQRNEKGKFYDAWPVCDRARSQIRSPPRRERGGGGDRGSSSILIARAVPRFPESRRRLIRSFGRTVSGMTLGSAREQRRIDRGHPVQSYYSRVTEARFVVT